MSDGNVLSMDAMLKKSWYEFDYYLNRLQAYGKRVEERMKK